MPTILNKSRELVHREPGVSNQRPKGPFGQFVVVGNGKAPMRGLSMPEDDVAPVLFIEFGLLIRICGLILVPGVVPSCDKEQFP